MTSSTTDSRQPLRVGVIGLGVWGPKHAVNAHGLREVELVALVDRDPTPDREMSRQVLIQQGRQLLEALRAQAPQRQESPA